MDSIVIKYWRENASYEKRRKNGTMEMQRTNVYTLLMYNFLSVYINVSLLVYGNLGQVAWHIVICIIWY